MLKKYIPMPVKRFIGTILRVFVYSNYDSTAYWKSRAKEKNQAAVLWQNEEYNNLYRKEQYQIIQPYLKNLAPNSLVLDIGCGIGVVSNMMHNINKEIYIEAVDFKEMIDIAKEKYPNSKISYVASSAEDYYVKSKKYDFIISSGCFSAIRNVEKMKEAIKNSTLMCKQGGTILMIDPFHKWNYLARVKFNSKDVEDYMKELGFKLEEKSGVIFWPYRDKLANSNLKGKALEKKYKEGEVLLDKLGRHFWADYKILAFKKI